MKLMSNKQMMLRANISGNKLPPVASGEHQCRLLHGPNLVAVGLSVVETEMSSFLWNWKFRQNDIVVSLVVYETWYYNDVIISTIASQITSLTIVYSTVYSRRRSKKTSKLRVTGLCEGNSPVTCEFPAQRASNAENISIWWRHHGLSTRMIKHHNLGKLWVSLLDVLWSVLFWDRAVKSVTLKLTCFPAVRHIVIPALTHLETDEKEI